MKQLLIIIILIVFNISCDSQNKVQTNNEEDIKKAIESSEKWLAIIDSSNFELSWETSAEIFKESVNKENWVKALEGIRSPLGKVENRELQSREFKTTLPGAPDGEFVIMVYKTKFENKENSYETITPMKDKDGEWRISGYYIK